MTIPFQEYLNCKTDIILINIVYNEKNWSLEKHIDSYENYLDSVHDISKKLCMIEIKKHFVFINPI